MEYMRTLATTFCVLTGGLLVTAIAFYFLEVRSGNQFHEQTLKSEIARNLDEKWNDCDSARRWVAEFKCSK